MRIPFRRRAGRHGNQRDERHPTGTCCRSTSYRPLRPWQVRERRFRLGRRGYHPAEVAEFLDRVAGDLEAAYRQLAESHQEAARVRNALRRWQAQPLADHGVVVPEKSVNARLCEVPQVHDRRVVGRGPVGQGRQR
ncbi:DivIVA domain-containing protein [Micromonospora sp. Llam7]|nr:DivIVA domain-containing protein [Micromonospora tarapacensis]